LIAIPGAKEGISAIPFQQILFSATIIVGNLRLVIKNMGLQKEKASSFIDKPGDRRWFCNRRQIILVYLILGQKKRQKSVLFC